MKVKGYCRICEEKIFVNQATKRMKTDVPHEDFIIVHKACVMNNLLNRAGVETNREQLMNTPSYEQFRKYRLGQAGISHKRVKGHR